MATDAAHHRPSMHQRGETTRRRILDTAIEVFGTYEYDGASTRMLAERAGVNLPAIQYYFGSKEGLYRAAIAQIIGDIEDRMAPVAARVAAALSDGVLERRGVLDLLHLLLATFAELVLSGDQPEARKRLLVRAEADGSSALEPLHASMAANVVGPARALVGRLIGRAADDERTALRTLAILGQVGIFCNRGARRGLGWGEIGADRVRDIQAIVREHTAAIFATTAAQS
ncbi:MAG TPA: CerR family C-terminal domain-containing protein [Stellaceae bacterium]|nr:CerR family C-terminal domain-containing protein [Stellaceae bacterium]